MTPAQPPVIGITCTNIRRGSTPLEVGQNQAYVDALVQAGAAPTLIPHPQDEPRLRSLYERLDGLLLPGGLDVDPTRYGEPKSDRCGPISPSRDEAELTLANRDTMGYRMLLGRRAVRGRFIVDPGRSYVCGKWPMEGRRKKRKKREEEEE